MALYWVSLARLELCLLEFPSLYGSGLELTRRKIWEGELAGPSGAAATALGKSPTLLLIFWKGL